ncbi:unnamed protein product [Acanthoscelides obtectus]|uniref:Uncharacterized protein n=1 Tax=Acanthoscelides obtectus TaxID=200917 RepID=A0A9P0PC36_ACAOB|nr:unnamed protein product [Acanthoscelides obtectus]CAK1633093.1 hypothetical protein AOBTE_LOCUS7945 [Acanthoscelides obtectus]
MKRQFTTILVIENRRSVVLTQRAYRLKYRGNVTILSVVWFRIFLSTGQW